MRVARSAITGEVGVSVLRTLFLDELGWLFRSQPESDYGIDAHVEPVVDGEASGKLLGLQVKAGASYFSERTSAGVVFRPGRDHVEYWLNHALPVLIVLVDVDAHRAWWEVVSEDTLVPTKSSWKVVVPDDHELTSASAAALLALSDGDPYVLRLRALQLARPWMEVLREGGSVIVELEEWVNKTSGRAAVQLTAVDADGTEVGSYDWPWIMLPFARYDVELPKLFPWADIEVEAETYDDADHDLYEAECGHRDEGSQTFYSETYEEWLEGRLVPALRPYADDGEVADWKLELTLNDLGSSFLRLDEYLGVGGLGPLVSR